MRTTKLLHQINKSIHRKIVLKQIEAAGYIQISIETIQKVVSDSFSISVKKMMLKTNKRESVLPRQVSMVMTREYIPHKKKSLSAIGLAHGSMGHATVSHAIKTIKNLEDTNKAYKVQFKEIRRKLNILTLSSNATEKTEPLTDVINCKGLPLKFTEAIKVLVSTQNRMKN